MFYLSTSLPVFSSVLLSTGNNENNFFPGLKTSMVIIPYDSSIIPYDSSIMIFFIFINLNVVELF